jgi:hypothetical protein
MKSIKNTSTQRKNGDRSEEKMQSPSKSPDPDDTPLQTQNHTPNKLTPYVARHKKNDTEAIVLLDTIKNFAGTSSYLVESPKFPKNQRFQDKLFTPSAPKELKMK